VALHNIPSLRHAIWFAVLNPPTYLPTYLPTDRPTYLPTYLPACLPACRLSMALQPLWTLASFSLFNVHTVGTTPLTGDQPVARPLPTHTTTQTQNKRTQTSMPRVGFEPTIPVSDRAKTVHIVDRAATVIGELVYVHVC
jgi:hypothetical protein